MGNALKASTPSVFSLPPIKARNMATTKLTSPETIAEMPTFSSEKSKLASAGVLPPTGGFTGLGSAGPGLISQLVSGPAASGLATKEGTITPVGGGFNIPKPANVRPQAGVESDPYERWKQLGRPGGNFDAWKAGQG